MSWRMVLQGPRAAAKHGDRRRRGRQVTEQIYQMRGSAVRLGELKFSCNFEGCIECNRSRSLVACLCKSVADCGALLWCCCGVCMHQTVLYCVPFRDCVFGGDWKVHYKKSTSLFAVPKAVQWVYRYHYSSWRFQMLGNWLLMKMQLEDQLRIGTGKPKSFVSVQLWCMCWGTCICDEGTAKWSVDTKQFV